MRIGISVLSHAGQNIWEHGLGQNVVFLAQSLRALPFVRAVDFIDAGDQDKLPPEVPMDRLGARLLRTPDAGDEVDVIIEFGGVLDPVWLALQRKRGKKVAYYCVGQPYTWLLQSSIFDKPDAFLGAGRWDQIWLLPMFAPLAPMMRVMHRCEVRTTPYIWSPRFLQHRIDEVAQLGLTFGWQPQRQPQAQPQASGQAQAQPRAPLRAAIFEPNIAVVKTASISMLGCDEAYRQEPRSVGMMHALNTLHMKDHVTMLHLANSLDLVRSHKACFHGRHDIVGFMAQHADAVVSHQWFNEQNYSYLDALHGDYPLIHNSPWLHSFGAGYYYPEMEAAEAGRQLVHAWREHDQRLPDQRRATQTLFASLDPLDAANQQAHAELLQQLCHDAPALQESLR